MGRMVYETKPSRATPAACVRGDPRPWTTGPPAGYGAAHMSACRYRQLAWLCLAVALPLRLWFFAGFGLGDDPNESFSLMWFAERLRLNPDDFLHYRVVNIVIRGLCYRWFGIGELPFILPVLAAALATHAAGLLLADELMGARAAFLTSLLFLVTPYETLASTANAPDYFHAFFGTAAAWGVARGVRRDRARPMALALDCRCEARTSQHVLHSRRCREESGASAEGDRCVFMDGGGENVNSEVDRLFDVEPLRRILAQVDVSYSNSLIEAWWRSLRHQWLYLNSLDTLVTVERLVGWCVCQHDEVLQHATFDGQTPDEIYFGRGADVPERLTWQRQEAQQSRLERIARRSAVAVRAPVARNWRHEVL